MRLTPFMLMCVNYPCRNIIWEPKEADIQRIYNSVNHGSLNYFPVLNYRIWLIVGLLIWKKPNSEYYN